MNGVHPFSPAGRQAALRQMADTELDLLIIGGGITGCGLARDAVLRGLRVGLVEKADFGYGTSSRSSKLIHGGLRYMAQGDVGMVWEAIRERAVLQTIAPHLVHPLEFLYPLFRGERSWHLRLGFRLFDLMAGRTAGGHRLLQPEEAAALAPGLREGLRAGLLYREFITDDGRFTLENGLSAALHGALLANYAAVSGFIHREGRIRGAKVRDHLTGDVLEVRAKAVVNATGPWALQTVGLGAAKVPGRILPSKGAHLLFRAERFPLTGAAVLHSPASGREGFAIRRWDYVYVGTTDEVYQGPLDQPVTDWDAAVDLLRLVRDCFPGLELTPADILATWAGLRPLVFQSGRRPRSVSRHDHVWRGDDGLITIAGGKLTTYRPMAHRILRAVGQVLGVGLGRDTRTDRVLLPGALAGGGPGEAIGAGAAGAAGEAFAALRDRLRVRLRAQGLPPQTAERLLWLYGARTDALLAFAAEEPRWLEPLAPGIPAVQGEVRLAVEQEMALTLLDFMDRRSALLLFSEGHGRAAAEPASRIMAGLLGWCEAERTRQVALYQAQADRATFISEPSTITKLTIET